MKMEERKEGEKEKMDKKGKEKVIRERRGREGEAGRVKLGG